MHNTLRYLFFTCLLLLLFVISDVYARILTPTYNTSIEGTLLMLDDRTPHVAVVVQAVNPSPDSGGEPVVSATVLSDESGRYQWKWYGRCLLFM